MSHAVIYRKENRMQKAMKSGALLDASKTLDGIEDLRKATANRVNALTRIEPDKDGVVRGAGFEMDHTDVAKQQAILDGLIAIEKQQTKDLEKLMKAHPLGATVANLPGVGAKQAARLLGVLGDPYWADRTEKTQAGVIVSVDSRPRTLRELYAYAGLGIAAGGAEARRPTKGMTQLELKALGRPEIKMRAWNIVGSIIKAQGGKNLGKGDYGVLYYAEKERLTGAVHSVDCKRCGPSGKPALAGSPLSDGHIDARARRLIMKALLADLYEAAKEWHEETYGVYGEEELPLAA